jgi:hypothetical protein
MILLTIFSFYAYKHNFDKKLFYLSNFIIFCVLIYLIYKNFFIEPVKENYLNFNFRNDNENIREKPEIYCGDSRRLPQKYDIMGTRYTCMKKGIGIGMNLPDESREEFINKPRVQKDEKAYCGNDLLLPENYTRFGTKKECLRKGVGVGLGMPQEKRRIAQQKTSQKLGKREIMELAQRLKINTDDLTRRQSIIRIANRLIQLNA